MAKHSRGNGGGGAEEGKGCDTEGIDLEANRWRRAGSGKATQYQNLGISGNENDPTTENDLNKPIALKLCKGGV